MSLEYFKIHCKVAFSQDIILRALKVSLIVGTLLNLINQSEALLTLNLHELHGVKFLLTYLIPYSVATYTATRMRLEFHIGTKAIIDADLRCKKCSCSVHVKRDHLIPECPTCGIYTKWKLK